MTEKQRSDAGLPYFPGDEELRALRARCKQLCYAFNTTEHISSGRNESICCASCWAAPMDAF